MLEALTRNWWVLLVRGLCAIAFGIAAFAQPGITLLVLVMLYAAHALVDGVMAIVLAVTCRRREEGWWALIIVGLAGIGAGIGAFVWPGITAAVLLVFVATWQIVRGVFEIITAVRLRKVIDNEWLMGLDGAVSVAVGAALLAWPEAGLITIVWFLGAGAIAFGILSIALSLRLRSLRNDVSRHSVPPGSMPA